MTTREQNKIMNKIKDIAPMARCFLYTLNKGVLVGNYDKYAICIAVGETTDIGEIIIEKLVDTGVCFCRVDSVEQFGKFVETIGVPSDF